jgi:hypothetical protein
MCAVLAKRVFAMSVQSSPATDKAVARALKDVAARIDSAVKRSGRTQPVSVPLQTIRSSCMLHWHARPVGSMQVQCQEVTTTTAAAAAAAATGAPHAGSPGGCQQDEAG